MTLTGAEERWMCGNCHAWNDIESEKCRKCKQRLEDVAVRFRERRSLSQPEQLFYTYTAPNILKELRDIKDELRGIRKELSR